MVDHGQPGSRGDGRKTAEPTPWIHLRCYMRTKTLSDWTKSLNTLGHAVEYFECTRGMGNFGCKAGRVYEDSNAASIFCRLQLRRSTGLEWRRRFNMLDDVNIYESPRGPYAVTCWHDCSSVLLCCIKTENVEFKIEPGPSSCLSTCTRKPWGRAAAQDFSPTPPRAHWIGPESWGRCKKENESQNNFCFACLWLSECVHVWQRSQAPWQQQKM